MKAQSVFRNSSGNPNISRETGISAVIFIYIRRTLHKIKSDEKTRSPDRISIGTSISHLHPPRDALLHRVRYFLDFEFLRFHIVGFLLAIFSSPAGVIAGIDSINVFRMLDSIPAWRGGISHE